LENEQNVTNAFLLKIKNKTFYIYRLRHCETHRSDDHTMSWRDLLNGKVVETVVL